MRASTVFKMFKDHPSFEGMEENEQFKNRLKDLCTKKAWLQSPARKFLVESFRKGTLKDDETPEEIFAKVKSYVYFKGMECDSTWKRRLKALIESHQKKKKAAQEDQVAFDDFRKKHPIRSHNKFGQPRWDGSKAQQSLAIDMAEGLHEQYKGKPQELWATRPEYQEFTKKSSNSETISTRRKK
jgi:hypothetical protein